MDGAYLGSCTLTGIPSGILASCSVLVPKGITVVVTEDVSTITPGYVPEENPIYFDTGTTTQASHWGPIFYHGLQPGSVSTGQTSNVFISTVIGGYPFHDACYVLVGYSDEVCAGPPDYVVWFHDVPLGTYTVRQTADLGPERWVDDFTIHVTGSGDWEGFDANVNMADSSSRTPTGTTFGVAIVTGEDGQIVDAA